MTRSATASEGSRTMLTIRGGHFYADVSIPSSGTGTSPGTSLGHPGYASIGTFLADYKSGQAAVLKAIGAAKASTNVSLAQYCDGILERLGIKERPDLSGHFGDLFDEALQTKLSSFTPGEQTVELSDAQKSNGWTIKVPIDLGDTGTITNVVKEALRPSRTQRSRPKSIGTESKEDVGEAVDEDGYVVLPAPKMKAEEGSGA